MKIIRYFFRGRRDCYFVKNHNIKQFSNLFDRVIRNEIHNVYKVQGWWQNLLNLFDRVIRNEIHNVYKVQGWWQNLLYLKGKIILLATIYSFISLEGEEIVTLWNIAILTLSWRRFPSYRNQSIDLQSKSVNWFLYDRELRHERVNQFHGVKIENVLQY